MRKSRCALFLLVLIAASARAQSFTWIGTVFDGDVQGALTVDGLSDAWATATSPDGAQVYVCSGIANSIGSDNAVAVFARDAASGKLTFVQVLRDDGDGGAADGLASCRDVVVSPDGKHVYTAGFSDSAIGIFTRSAVDGALTFSGVVADGVPPVSDLAGVHALALSPDGATLFAQSRSTPVFRARLGCSL